MQVDSQVEVLFVEHRLKFDTKVLFYFKFPPAFKVHFPRVIGNYNPDCGIVRYDETGRVILHLIRETKGTQAWWLSDDAQQQLLEMRTFT